jgi:hypothetical protein
MTEYLSGLITASAPPTDAVLDESLIRRLGGGDDSDLDNATRFRLRFSGEAPPREDWIDLLTDRPAVEKSTDLQP